MRAIWFYRQEQSLRHFKATEILVGPIEREDLPSSEQLAARMSRRLLEDRAVASGVMHPFRLEQRVQARAWAVKDLLPVRTASQALDEGLGRTLPKDGQSR